MKKIYILVFIILYSISFAQTLTRLFEQQKFDELISYQNKTETLSGEDLYYVGYAFFRKENDVKAIEFYDLALKKGFNNAAVYFQKGFSNLYLNNLEEALKNYDIAISKAPKAEYFIEKGRIYKMKGNLSEEIKNYEEGLQKSTVDKYYPQLVEITGNFYYAQSKEYDKAVTIYKNGLAKLPEHYILYEKLIKSLNAQGKYQEANQYFEKVKRIYSQNKLPEDYMKFKNMPIDEFEWNGQWLNVFKSFVEPENVTDALYTIYLADKNGEIIERKFNIEKTFQLNKNDAKYLVCEELKNGHQTYSIGWKNDQINLVDIRNAIISILNNKEKIVGSVKLKK